MALFTLFSIFLLVILPLFSLLLFTKVFTKKVHNLPPGPSRLPLIGNLHQLGELPYRSLHKLSQKHGPLMYLKLGTIPTIVASSPDTAKAFLKTHDLDTCSRPLLTAFGKISYGFSDISFIPFGEKWRVLRKISMIHLFSSKKVASFRSVREEEVERMVSSISTTGGVNLSEELLLMSNNITCRSALGKRYYSEDPTDKGRLSKILKETQALLVAFFIGDYIPILGWVDGVSGMRRRLEENFRELDEFYQQVIEEHRNAVMRRDEDAVDALLDIQKSDDHLSDDQIKAILTDIFLAGTDTSSTAIEWAMTELMRNPQTMKKAQDEVRDHVGKKGKVEESDLDQLHYLKSVVKETMRLHPPGPLLLPRETIRYCNINGYDIPAKSRLFINVWAIGRDANLWDSPEDFYPDRFLDSPINFLGHDFEFIPFGAGRRICPGMPSGILVVELALANLLYHFKWELPMGMSREDIDMDEAPGIAVHRKSSLYLMATKYYN